MRLQRTIGDLSMRCGGREDYVPHLKHLTLLDLTGVLVLFPYLHGFFSTAEIPSFGLT